ncbi:MAG: DUF1080 domain-containing protein [Planctomycetes bacterium]|nr:DUF1080 domain-containing protein [Planctomycetota bacterium]
MGNTSVTNRIGWLGLTCLLAGLVVTPLLTAEEPKVAAAPAVKWKPLFDGKTLKNWKSSQFGGEGDIEVKDGTIVMSQGSEMTGIVWDGAALPKMNYEISLNAKRIEGGDFFCGLTFQVKDDPCSLIIGGWGGGVVGISSLDGQDAANNETACFESFDRGKWYKIRMRVSEQGLMAWIDDKQVVGVETKGRKIGIRPEVELSRPLGVSCYATVAGLKDIQIRDLTPEEAKAPITPPKAR